MILTRAYCNQRAFRAIVVPTQNRVEVSFDPALWNKRLSASLIVRTNSSKEPVCTIPLRVGPAGNEEP
jgi:hypothetical protein